MIREEIIKSALKFLAQKQIEQGSLGFSDDNDNEVSWNEVIEWLDQQPWKDYISRELVIEWLKDKDIIKTKNQEENAREKLAELSSVTPVTLTRPTGYWIHWHPLQEDDDGAYMCSNCKHGDWDCDTSYKHCPFCGAKMIKP